MSLHNQNEKQPSVKKDQRWVNLGIFFTTVAIVVLLCTFTFAYFELAKTNLTLAQMQIKLDEQNRKASETIASLQNAFNTLQLKTQNESTQVSQVLTQWENIQHGNLKTWQLKEAHYLVKLADDYLRFGREPELAQALLDEANNILNNINNPSLSEIQQSIQDNINILKSANSVNTSEIYLQLTNLNQQIENLPLIVNDKQKMQISYNAMTQDNLPWWKKGLMSSWDALQKIVLVKRIDESEIPLVMPDEKNFLLQNLHAQIEYAVWGLLHRNVLVYQTSLASAIAWTKKYFDQNAQVTQTVIGKLVELQKINIHNDNLNLTNTLKLFDSLKSST